MLKGPGLPSFRCETAGIGHRCGEIAMQYLRVACAAAGIRGADRRYHLGEGTHSAPQCQCQDYSPISIDPA